MPLCPSLHDSRRRLCMQRFSLKNTQTHRLLSFQSFDIVFQQNLAITAELIGFAVDITLIAAIMHQTGMFLAMTQFERVAQLVNGFLGDTT